MIDRYQGIIYFGWIAVVVLAVAFFRSGSSRPEPWEGANRCQTLDLMREAANANLEHEVNDPKIDRLFKAIDEAISACTADDFRGLPHG